MSDKVVDIRSKQPHMSGPAICLMCGHQWIGVCEVGIVHGMRCPNCKLLKGVYEGLCVSESPTQYFECECGNAHFMLLNDGNQLCVLCGKEHGFI